MAQTTKESEYARLTPSLCIQLAAPQTWVAAVAPVMLSVVYVACTYSGVVNLLMTLILLVICILMQSAVNTFNDYFDFKKGTDTEETISGDAYEAALVYNNLNPRHVLVYAIGLLVVAAILGVYVVSQTSWIPLAVGVVGALAVVLYSGGRTPISYLPIGEFVSGFVMGGLIPLACCYVLSGIFSWYYLIISLPCIFGIGMILATNNTSDIEKDQEAQRSTLAVILGREKAVKSYKIALALWLVSTIGLVTFFYPAGMPIMLFMLILLFPVLRAILMNPLTLKTRDASMSQIVSLNIIVIGFYCFSLVVATSVMWS